MAGDVIYPLAGKRVWVAGHRGMVGGAVARRLAQEDCEVVTVGRAELDLRAQEPVAAWLAVARVDAVVMAAAKVGGILANAEQPAQFLYDNLVIETNVIEAARQAGVEKLLLLGSSCIYPRLAPQPIPEDALLTGPLEATNEWYAIAKIAGIKLCQAYRAEYGCDFISAMPSNLYGPGDNFDLRGSHVVAALMRKMHEAKLAGRDTVEVWGSGEPRRELLYVDDCADGLVHLLKTYSEAAHVNVGSGSDVTIRELAATIAAVVGYQGDFVYDRSKPDGTPRKLLDVSKLAATGWQARTPLADGLGAMYAWYLENVVAGAAA